LRTSISKWRTALRRTCSPISRAMSETRADLPETTARSTPPASAKSMR
jgi:hypothetical protein